MELLHHCSFRAADVTDTSGELTCHVVHEGKRLIFAGMNSGAIVLWRRRAHESSGDCSPDVCAARFGVLLCTTARSDCS